jgi:hypothetical protein
MLNERTITHWKAEHIEGQGVVQLTFGLGFDQSVTVNLSPHIVPHLSQSLLGAWADHEAWLEGQEDDQ